MDNTIDKKRLLIGVHSDKFHTVEVLFNHPVYGIIACAADTDYHNPCAAVHVIHFYL